MYGTAKTAKTAKTAIFGTADPVVFETAMLVVVFEIAAPSWVLASSYCKDWSALYVFTSTHLKLFSFNMF